jgi:uncharacterized protein (DUF2336 family)
MLRDGPDDTPSGYELFTLWCYRRLLSKISAAAMQTERVFAELKSLAEERSSEKRLDLLRKIADLFFAHIDEHSEAETSLFNEVINQVVDQISHDGKIVVATDLATLPGFPTLVVRKLAHDSDIEIARPVLRSALGLSERDLVEIARKASDAHLDAIAGRAQLSEAVTDVLIDRGSREVLCTVSANHGAAFSESGMDKLISRAHDDGALQGILVERSDLSQSAIDQLSSIVSEALAIKLAERGYQLAGKIPEHIAKEASAAFARAVHERDRNTIAAERIITEFGAGRMTLEEALLGVIKCEQMLAVAALLSHRTGLERNKLLGMLNGGTQQTVLVLLRALDLKWATVSALMAYRAKKQRTRETPGAGAQRDYEAIDATAARRTLRFLQVRARVENEASDNGFDHDAIKQNRIALSSN